MAYSTLPIAYGPVFPVAREQKPRLNLSTYGDGYEQASGDGINIFKPVIPVRWEGLTLSEAQTLDTFMTNAQGITPFMWTFPGDGTATQYVCRRWKYSFEASNSYSFDADFSRNFNP